MAQEDLAIGDTGSQLVQKFNNNFNDVFQFQDIGTLPPGADPVGDEKIVTDQAGNGVYLTPDQIVGGPIAVMSSHSRNKFLYASTLEKAPFSYSFTNGQQYGAEPFSVIGSGTNARVTQNSGIFNGYGCAQIYTGTDIDGKCGILHSVYPIIFQNLTTVRYRGSYRLRMSNTPTPAQNYECRIGFLNDIGSTNPSRGFFFLGGNATGPNWQAVNSGPGGVTMIDTSIPINNQFIVLTVDFYGPDSTVNYYADGQLLESINTNLPNDIDTIGFVVGMIKTAGIQERSCIVDQHSLFVDSPTAGLDPNL